MSERDPNSMPRIDAETLAALIDGRLSAADRARVLEQLASSEADYEAYLDAVQLTRELEATIDAPMVARTVTATQVADIATARRRSPWPRLLAAAAVLAMVVTTTWLMMRPGGSSYAPGQLLAAVDPAAVSVEGWDQPPWRVVRAADATIDDRALAVRLGVRLVNLELAQRANDAVAARDAAHEVVTLAEQLPGGALYATAYRELAALPLSDARWTGLIRTGWDQIAAAVPVAELRLGAWLGAARLALLSDHAAWLQTDAAQDARRAIDVEALEANVREAWEELLRAIDANGADTRERVDAVLQAIAG